MTIESTEFSIEDVYRDLHEHPELSFQEHRTAGIVADHLKGLGYEVTTGVGKTGVVGILERGNGPTVLLRADMDALPVKEQTGLPYASDQTGTMADGTTTPVMHACGHDVHTSCLMGAAVKLKEDQSWSGRLMLVFQPAEELGQGAKAMISDGLYERFKKPDIVLGQHVASLPAGTFGIHPGPAFSASDALVVTLYGKGGHGSRPETTQDPIVMAANFVVRLQEIVSRVIAGTDMAVVTVGSIHAGTAANIIPDRAVLELSIRTFDPDVRRTVLDTVERYAKAEAYAVGAEREPTIEVKYSFPAVVNDPAVCDEVRDIFLTFPGASVVDPGSVTGSEDVGVLAKEAGAKCCYWLLGSADPKLFADATTQEELLALLLKLPSNHSPYFAPEIEPTLHDGVEALVATAKHWLD